MKNIQVNMIRLFLFIFLCSFSLFARGQEEVEYTVLSETGKFLENVKISVKEYPGNRTFTDANGKFEIMAEDNQHFIVEYENAYRKTVKVSDIGPSGKIVLDAGSRLVNVGNGQETRMEELVSSVGFAGREKLEKVTALDVGNTLFGQIQGLRAFQNAGYFPDNRIPNLNIRGQATLQDGSILILVDGVERALNTVLPEEIESVSVLRDAAAKARYGQRGANGVLLLNTKRGSKSATRYFASVEQGFTQPTRLPEFLNAASYAKAENEARLNDGLAPRYSDAEINYFQSGQYPYLYPNVNWLDETLADNGYFSRYNFGVSGGNDITNYFVSLNYQNDKGLFEHTDTNDDYSTQIRNDKVNMRTNLDIKVTPTTLLQVNLGGFVSVSRQPATSGDAQANTKIISDAFAIPSALFPVENEDGSWGGTNQFGNNPVAQISDAGFDQSHIRFFFNELRIKQDLNFLIDGLSAEIFGAYYSQSHYWENKTKTYSYAEVTPILDASGNITDVATRTLGDKTDLSASRYLGDQRRSSYDMRGELSYSKIFGDHAVNAWALFHQNQLDMYTANRVYRYRNYAGNVHYGFVNRYFLDGTVSYSGSNRIQNREDRFGLFPAIAGAWMISNEPFMKNAGFLNMLKIRASYGKTGNGLIEIRDLTGDKYGGGNSFNFGDAYQSLSGTRETERGITHKKFETALESNVGIEAELFDRLKLTGELFSMKRKNIFVPAEGQYSTVLGLLPLNVPEGEVHNKGYELEATWSDRAGDFNYYLSGMFSRYKNERVNINEEYRPYDYLKRTGQPVGQNFGLKTEGFFRDEADIAGHATQMFGVVQPGDIIYADLNGDNIIDEYDLTAIGYSNVPEIYYSLSFGVGWKGIEVSALLQGTGKSSAYLSQSHVFWPLLGNNGNISTWYDNYWSQSNRDGAELPRLSKQSDNNYRSNDLWVRNNSFLKLRYAEISYSFPKKLLGNYGLQKLKVYLRARDLFCFDNIKYVDPENIGTTYPSLASYNIGIAVNF